MVEDGFGLWRQLHLLQRQAQEFFVGLAPVFVC
jgi:hypothetical protein